MSELSALFQRPRQLRLCDFFRRHTRTINLKDSEFSPAKESIQFRADATKILPPMTEELKRSSTLIPTLTAGKQTFVWLNCNLL